MTIQVVKDRLRRLLFEMSEFELNSAKADLQGLVEPNALIQFTNPFETLRDVDELFQIVYRPLVHAIPDLERRMTIVVSGRTEGGAEMVGTCGYYTGAFRRPWLGIPASGQQVTMRFHEFFRIGENGIEEIQAVWDLPELMMQTGSWPMAPALRRSWNVPTPSSQDGLHRAFTSMEESAFSAKLVSDMLEAMGRHPKEPVEAMQLERFWHPRMTWYGPAAIGTCRGVEGFRNGHQIPFLRALPDRRGDVSGGFYFSEGPYVAFTGWPGMQMTVSGDGWLGINPDGSKITMRSLDFWRVEKGRIKENWVLIDMLHVWAQLGVDVLARAAELTSQGERDEKYR